MVSEAHSDDYFEPLTSYTVQSYFECFDHLYQSVLYTYPLAGFYGFYAFLCRYAAKFFGRFRRFWLLRFFEANLKMMNVFWMRLGVCADDVVFSQDSKSLCELGDPSEFIAYGEARCMEVGIEDDAEAAGFLLQAFQGDVKLWCDSLPEEVQSSWCLLKQALVEEFGDGQVMASMQLLREVWWQVPNFEQCFDVLWKVYERVSFFHGSFVYALKKRMLEKYKKASMQLQGLYEDEVVDEAFQGCMHKKAIGMDNGFEDIVTIRRKDMPSTSSSLVQDESEAMDDLSSDEATSFFDEESLYASSTEESDEAPSVVDEENMHDVLNNEASFEGQLEKCSYLVIDVMEPMHEEGSIGNTKGVGKQEDLMCEDFRHEDVVECKDHDDEDMHVEDTCEEFLELDASREDDLQDIASLDEQEPMMEMDARMAECVAKATLRIKEALKAKKATSLRAYESMHVMKLVEEDSIHVESQAHVTALESVCILVGESEDGEVNMNVLDQQRCQNGLMMMVMYQATHGFWGLHEEYDMGDYAFVLDSFEYDKACMPRLENGCKNSFVYDPGGLGRHMMMADWKTCIWPFDPGGCWQ